MALKAFRLAFVVSCVCLLTAGPVASAATLVVGNKGEATVSLIALGSGKVVATLPTGESPHEVGISKDGTMALITNYGNREAPGSTMTLIDVVRAEVVKTIELPGYTRPHGVVWLADGKRAVVTAEDQKALLIVDVEGGKVASAIDTAQEISHMVAVGPGDARAFIANIGSGSVTVVDLATGKRVANVATGDGAEGVAVTAAGHAWVTNRAADTLTILNAASLDVIATLESPGFPIRATAAGTKVLVTRAKAGDLAIYDDGDIGKVTTIPLKLEAKDVEGRLFGDRFGKSSVPIGVVVDDGATRAWIAHANADVISEVDLVAGKISRRLTAGREPDGMAYTLKEVAQN